MITPIPRPLSDPKADVRFAIVKDQVGSDLVIRLQRQKSAMNGRSNWSPERPVSDLEAAFCLARLVPPATISEAGDIWHAVEGPLSTQAPDIAHRENVRARRPRRLVIAPVGDGAGCAAGHAHRADRASFDRS